MEVLEEHPAVLILRMRNVPFIDATGINNLKEVIRDFTAKKQKSFFPVFRNHFIMIWINFGLYLW